MADLDLKSTASGRGLEPRVLGDDSAEMISRSSSSGNVHDESDEPALPWREPHRRRGQLDPRPDVTPRTLPVQVHGSTRLAGRRVHRIQIGRARGGTRVGHADSVLDLRAGSCDGDEVRLGRTERRIVVKWSQCETGFGIGGSGRVRNHGGGEQDREQCQENAHARAYRRIRHPSLGVEAAGAEAAGRTRAAAGAAAHGGGGVVGGAWSITGR